MTKGFTPVLNVTLDDGGHTYRVPFYASGRALMVMRKTPAGRETALQLSGKRALAIIAKARPAFDAKIAAAQRQAEAEREAREQPSPLIERRLNFWGY